MGRIAKDPEERKNELMDAALELFLEKGFENTAVNDIVKKVGVAQGLFYYYFGSKQDMLDAALDRYIGKLMCMLANIANDTSMAIEDKFQSFLDTFFGYGESNEKFAADLHQEKNRIIHQKLTDKTIEAVAPLLLQIIRDGVQKGLFHTSYPEETVAILVPGMMDYIHKYSFVTNAEALAIKTKAAGEIIERMLGAQKGSIKINLPAATQ
jgi:AcrR family transcriptional regulator